jgi:hypothetical protein
MMPGWLQCTKRLRLGHLCFAAAILATAPSPGQVRDFASWNQPAAALAVQVSDLLGPGPVAFSVRNFSSIPTDQVSQIRRLLQNSLKSHGVTTGDADSANVVRVTLSENAHERLWVAEVIQGNQTKVAMVEFGITHEETSKASEALVLSRQIVLSTQGPILAVLEVPSGILMLKPEKVAFYAKQDGTWKEAESADIGTNLSLGRDPRGALLGNGDGTTFDAWLPGVHCAGAIVPVDAKSLKLTCNVSDDPWAVTQPPFNLAGAQPLPSGMNVIDEPIRAFYNASRNSFTGILAPSFSQDLPPFYSLAIVPRPSGFAVLTEGIDGKVQLAENGKLHAIAGTRDWGSDLAVLRSGCGPGDQLIVSGSGDAASDSLRAYELPLHEAVPASEPLEVDGSVMALDVAADSKSLLAIVRKANMNYEVDRVTAICN